MSHPGLSIVLPCYNEARNIPLVLARFREVKGAHDFELILVDNGSTDDSASVLASELAEPENAFARTVTVAKNQGYGHGVMTGLLAARGEYLAFSHADMQCDPAHIFVAYDLLTAQPDPRTALVKGYRVDRALGEKVVTLTCQTVAMAILWRHLYDINGQPKVFHHSFLEHLHGAPSGFEFDVFVLFRMLRRKMRQLDVPVPFPPRPHGQSNWSASLRSRARTTLRFVSYCFRLRLGWC